MWSWSRTISPRSITRPNIWVASPVVYYSLGLYGGSSTQDFQWWRVCLAVFLSPVTRMSPDIQQVPYMLMKRLKKIKNKYREKYIYYISMTRTDFKSNLEIRAWFTSGNRRWQFLQQGDHRRGLLARSVPGGTPQKLSGHPGRFQMLHHRSHDRIPGHAPSHHAPWNVFPQRQLQAYEQVRSAKAGKMELEVF